MDQNQAPVDGGNTPAQAQGEKKDYTKWIVIGVVVIVGLYIVQYLFSPARMAEHMVERAIEKQTGGDVDIDINPMMGGKDASVSIKGENGETYHMNAGEDVALPDNWPSDIPLLDDAKITYAGTMGMGMGMGMNGDAAGMSVVYTTAKSANDAADFYKKELVQNGWTLAGTMAVPGGSMVHATKGDMVATVSIGGDESGTTVTVAIGKDQ